MALWAAAGGGGGRGRVRWRPGRGGVEGRGGGRRRVGGGGISARRARGGGGVAGGWRVRGRASGGGRGRGGRGGDVVGRGRHKRVVMARAVTTYLARALTTLSYPEIARAMGRPNHSTVVTACQRITGQIERNETLPAADWGDWGATGGGAAGEMTVGALCEQVRRDILRLPAA